MIDFNWNRKVIRHCHPDKHSHLDSIGEEFLELKKVFTVLSDAYSRYKNDLAAYNWLKLLLQVFVTLRSLRSFLAFIRLYY